MITQCSKTRQNDVKYFILCTILWLTLMSKVLQIWQLGCTVSKKALLNITFQNERKKKPSPLHRLNRTKQQFWLCTFVFCSACHPYQPSLTCCSARPQHAPYLLPHTYISPISALSRISFLLWSLVRLIFISLMKCMAQEPSWNAWVI